LLVYCAVGIDDALFYALNSNKSTLICKLNSNHLVTFLFLFDTLASVALTSVALTSVAHYYNAMVTTNAPRATTQLTLQRFALTAVEEKWSASRLAREADCNIQTAEKFLSRLATSGMERTQKEVLTLADSYRHTLERTAARSREYLESISHLDLDSLDKDQRSLRKDALSSLSSLSSMLRLEITGDASASTPPRLGNL
jgi:hypothetical protein